VPDSAHLSLNQPVQVRTDHGRVIHGRVIIEPAVPGYNLEDLLAGITSDNRHAGADFGAPKGQEVLWLLRLTFPMRRISSG
jgi:antitoxin component of MazEF toxin-antitoxin module